MPHAYPHWRAPTVLVTTWATAILLMFAHHFWYSKFDGVPVAAESIDWGVFQVSQQQFNLAIATAIAFCVKVFLVACVTTAYAQLFWIRSAKQPLVVGNIDKLLGVINNGFLIFWLMVWKQQLVLFALACIIWLLPIAAILTPATLSVKPFISRPTSLREMPAINFTGGMTVQPQSIDDLDYRTHSFEANTAFIAYRPLPLVNNIAYATATRGEILSIPGLEANLSWTSRFAGPGLSCEKFNPAPLLLSQLNDWGVKTVGYYASWTPENGSESRNPRSFPSIWTNASIDGSTYQVRRMYTLRIGPWNSCELPGRPPLSLFFAVLDPDSVPDIADTYEVNPIRNIVARQTNTPATELDTSLPLSLPMASGRWATWKCDLRNTTYVVDFNITNGVQNTRVTTDHIKDGGICGLPWLEISKLCTLLDTHSLTGNNTWCFSNATNRRMFAYQSIMNAFNELIVGEWSGSFGDSGRDVPIVANNVLLTLLARTGDLGKLHAAMFNYSSWGYKPYGFGNRSLGEVAEELFANMTVSLLSARSLRMNTISHNENPQVNVTEEVLTYNYVYSAAQLWLAYGIALAFTSMAMILALIAIITNSQAYSSDFSTILRSTRRARLSTNILSEDATGEDPLPKHLERAVIRFGDHLDEHELHEPGVIYQPNLHSDEHEVRLHSTAVDDSAQSLIVPDHSSLGQDRPIPGHVYA